MTTVSLLLDQGNLNLSIAHCHTNNKPAPFRWLYQPYLQLQGATDEALSAAQFIGQKAQLIWQYENNTQVTHGLITQWQQHTGSHHHSFSCQFAPPLSDLDQQPLSTCKTSQTLWQIIQTLCTNSACPPQDITADKQEQFQSVSPWIQHNETNLMLLTAHITEQQHVLSLQPNHSGYRLHLLAAHSEQNQLSRPSIEEPASYIAVTKPNLRHGHHYLSEIKQTQCFHSGQPCCYYTAHTPSPTIQAGALIKLEGHPVKSFNGLFRVIQALPFYDSNCFHQTLVYLPMTQPIPLPQRKNHSGYFTGKIIKKSDDSCLIHYDFLKDKDDAIEIKHQIRYGGSEAHGLDYPVVDGSHVVIAPWKGYLSKPFLIGNLPGKNQTTPLYQSPNEYLWQSHDGHSWKISADLCKLSLADGHQTLKMTEQQLLEIKNQSGNTSIHSADHLVFLTEDCWQHEVTKELHWKCNHAFNYQADQKGLFNAAQLNLQASTWHWHTTDGKFILDSKNIIIHSQGTSAWKLNAGDLDFISNGKFDCVTRRDVCFESRQAVLCLQCGRTKLTLGAQGNILLKADTVHWKGAMKHLNHATLVTYA